MATVRCPDLDGIAGTHMIVKRSHQRHPELSAIVGSDVDNERVQPGEVGEFDGQEPGDDRNLPVCSVDVALRVLSLHETLLPLPSIVFSAAPTRQLTEYHDLITTIGDRTNS